MGLLGFLGEAAKESYENFKKDPAGHISDAVYDLNEKYERNKEHVYKVGEQKARTLTDDQLRRHEKRMEQSGNAVGQEIARREMERRGL